MAISPSIEDSLEKISRNLEHFPNNHKLSVAYLKTIADGMKNLPRAKFKEAVDDIENTLEEDNKIRFDSAEKTKETTSRTSKAAQILGEKVKDLSEATTDVTKRTFNTGKNLLQYQSGLESTFYALSELPMIGSVFAALGTLAAVADSTIESFRVATQAGVQFDKGIFGLFKASGELGLSIEESSRLFKENNTIIQRVGLPAFTGFLKNVRTNNSELGNLGLSYKDLIEYGSEYLTIQRNISGLQTLDRQEEKLLFNKTVKEFYRASQLTGSTVTELMEQFKKMSEDPALRLVLEQLPVESRATLAVLKEQSPELANIVQQSMLRGSITRADEYTKLIATGMEGYVNQLVSGLQQGLSIEQAKNLLKPVVPEMDRTARLFYDRNQDEYADLVAGFGATINKWNDVAAASVDRVDDTTSALLNLPIDINNLISEVRQKLLDFVAQLGDGDSNVGKMFKGAVDGIHGFLTSPNTLDTLKGLGTGIKDFVASLYNGAGIFNSWFGIEGPFMNAITLGVGLLLTKVAAGAAIKMAANGLLSSALPNGGIGKTKPRMGKAGLAVLGATGVALGGAYLYDQFMNSSDEIPTPATTPGNTNVEINVQNVAPTADQLNRELRNLDLNNLIQPTTAPIRERIELPIPAVRPTTNNDLETLRNKPFDELIPLFREQNSLYALRLKQNEDQNTSLSNMESAIK